MRKSTKGRGPVIVAALGTVVVALLFFGSPLWVMLEEEPIPLSSGSWSCTACWPWPL